MCCANGSSKWHTPAYYIWPSRLLARTLPSQGRERGIETPLGHQGKANIPVNQMCGWLT